MFSFHNCQVKKKPVYIPFVVVAVFLVGTYFFMNGLRPDKPFHQRYDEALKEIKFEDLTVGHTPQAVVGDEVEIHYTAKLENGTLFDSTYDRKMPQKFILGKSQVVAGLDLGVVGMQVSGKRKISVPAVLGYGDKPVGDLIPANSNLVFEVELLSAKKQSTAVSEVQDKPKKKSAKLNKK